MSQDVLQSAAPTHRFILLTDIVQSSRLAEQYGPEYLAALEQHNQLVKQAVDDHAGTVYKQTGDGYLVLFETARSCIEAALDLGEALGRLSPLVEGEQLMVRLALHAGELQPSGDEYFGPALNRVSRICQVCNPGQVLLSDAVKAALPKSFDGFALLDLGQHHLRDLAEPEQLYQLNSERLGYHDFPPISTLDNRTNNLVRQPNHFIGRERELNELASLLLDDTYLLSITAPGGYGKSRLAAQLCANLLHRFEHGVFVVYLAPVRESMDVPTAIANALGYQFAAGGTPEQQLCDYLRAKELLLCIDNFEHVLDRAPLVAELLRAAPKLKVVITSREPLRIEGEHIYRLEPLGVETGEGGYSDAELLFADRAALVKQGYALTPENAAQVRHFCEHLSGIPLAIELAAAWIDNFTLDELHDDLSSRLELEARTSDKPGRHQSLQACLDWSWQLLGQEQQVVLMKLSTFRGGFFREAASAVLGIPGMKLRSALARLTDKSWLFTREMDGQTRFFLRDMLAHEYAFARLEETRSAGGTIGSAHNELAGTAALPIADDSLFEQAVAAHATYFTALVEREGPRLRGGGTPDGGSAQRAAMRCWRLELDNILEALDSGLRREEVSWLLPIARHLRLFLDRTSDFFTQRDRFKSLLEAKPARGTAELRLEAQLGLGRAQWRLGEYSAARELYAQALELSQELDDQNGEANCLINLGNVEGIQGNYSAARELHERGLALRRELGDPNGEANSLISIGTVANLQGNYGVARELYEQAQALIREVGDCRTESVLLHNLGILEIFQENYGAARELFERSLALDREFGDHRSEAVCLNNLGAMEHIQGNYGAARELHRQSLAFYRDLGSLVGEAYCLINLGVVVEHQGNYSAAREMYEQALQICYELRDLRGQAESLSNLGNTEQYAGKHSVAREMYEQALAIYRELGDRRGEAISLNNFGSLETAEGNYSVAREMYEQALAINSDLGSRLGKAKSLTFLGILEYLLSNHSPAMKLYKQALSLSHELGEKPETAIICICAGVALAALDHPRVAALAIYGGQHGAAKIGYKLEPDRQKVLDSGLARLDAAVADGNITAEELLQWRAEAEAMSIDKLAEFVLAEVDRLEAISRGEGAQPGQAAD